MSLPRFLLPQLTWRGARTARLRPPPVVPSQPAFHPASQHASRRTLTTQSPPSSPPRSLRPPPRTRPQMTRAIHVALRDSLLPAARTPRPFPFAGAPAAAAALSFHRAFSSTFAGPRDHHFDTLKFVQRLRSEGFSEEQAVALMHVLSDVVEESIQNLTRTMVPREDAERATYTQKVDFTKLRSELQGADGAEAQAARASHERLANELAKLDSRLRDEVGRTQASVRLDLNLEKGRIREEANVQELKIKETEARIEQEVAGLRERIEGVKFSTLQWLM